MMPSFQFEEFKIFVWIIIQLKDVYSYQKLGILPWNLGCQSTLKSKKSEFD